MGQSVGYPEEILQEDKVSSLYSELEMVEGDFFASALALDRFWSKWHNQRLRKPIDRSNWLVRRKCPKFEYIFNKWSSRFRIMTPPCS